MALPAIAGLAALLPLLSKVPGALKALYKSKHFWSAAIGAGLVGQTGLSELGRAGERKLTKEQM